MLRRAFLKAAAAIPFIGRLAPASTPTPLDRKRIIMDALRRNGRLCCVVDPANKQSPVSIWYYVEKIDGYAESQPGISDLLTQIPSDNYSTSPGDERQDS